MFANQSNPTHPTQKNGYGVLLFMILAILIFRMLAYSPYRIPSGSMIPTLLVGDYLVVSRHKYGWSRYNLFFGNKIHYFSGRVAQWAKPQRGDIIVFTCPVNTEQDYIKRVIGLPGDKVQILEGAVWLNDEKLPLQEIPSATPYIAHDNAKFIQGPLYEETLPKTDGTTMTHRILKIIPFGSTENDTLGPITVLEDHLLVLGDNRDGSGDSRFMLGDPRDSNPLGLVPVVFLIGQALFIHYSIDKDFRWYKPWAWPFHIRYNRILTVLK